MLTADTLIIGAGLSGLTAAYQLHQAGRSFRLIEAGLHPGGLIQSHREAGYLTEAGPNTFPSTALEILALCNQLNIQPKAAHCHAKKRYLYLQGRLMALPGNPWEALTTAVLSLGGKLRVLQEPFKPRTHVEDISVGAFLEKRLGREVVDHLADPFISGIYAGHIHELSLPAVFPQLWQWEQTAGSLLKGAKQAKKSKPAQKREPLRLLSFTDGLETLTQALVKRLPPEACLWGNSVTHIETSELGYAIQTHTGQQLTGRHLVLAIPAHIAAHLLAPLDPQASQVLAQIHYNGLAVIHLGFQREAIPHLLDGFGCLIPRREKLPLLGTIWASSLFPDRAPEGEILLSNFIGGAHHPEICGWHPPQIEQVVLDNLQQVFKTKHPLKPVYSQTLVYDKAIPQYHLGHIQRIQTIEQALLKSNPHIQLCGNYLHGIALNECVKSGMAAAQKVRNAAR